MRVVIGTVALAYPGGTETYCLTVARALDRLGHEVTLFADELGPLAEHALDGGFDIAPELAELPAACDAVLVNDAVTAGLLAERYPDARRVYCVHSSLFDVQLPPLAPGVIHAIVAPSERFAVHARALALDVPVIRLTQPIDTMRFAPSAPLPVTPRRALLLTNYLEGNRRDALVQAWTEAGIQCDQVGAGTRLAFDVRPEIAQADIVVAKSRAALEAMACGKAVYVFDAFGADGWVTAETYPAAEADGFAGQSQDHPLDRGQLARDLERYDPDMGWINRDLILKHHDVRTHATRLVEVMRGEGGRSDQSSAPAATARATRYAWRMQRRAATNARDATALRTRAEELQAERDAWEARALEAERQLKSARELMARRPARAGSAISRRLDRLRGRR